MEEEIICNRWKDLADECRLVPNARSFPHSGYKDFLSSMVETDSRGWPTSLSPGPSGPTMEEVVGVTLDVGPKGRLLERAPIKE